ncbi:MAG TPA: sulfite exporter TauE/SafE family protein [Povalibacter sp.]|uniref:sulfite exporter TauE/SafE family protein n=1 Tax=Povalibacter sp. TaxID=1962978 RepID=UPI002B66D4FD|nr:sulfite exporter TauE/SafE family protein [Povalibacter sp.]HMN43382.1 sulfite exporter TauE/SafE family protein [Povalibacter sp.]
MDIGDPLLMAVAALAALLVGLSKGGLSMLGTLAVPVLALMISPVTAAALLLPIFVVSDLFGLWSYRREFDVRNLRILIASGIVGIAIGWATASIISERWVGLIIGCIGVLFCLNAWRQRNAVPTPRPADVPRGLFWGTLTGFSSFVSHSGGPTYQVYVLPQQLPKAVYAGTTTIVFAAINAVKLLPYWALGQFTPANLRAAAWLMPVAVAGTFIGVRLVRILPQKTYFGFVQIVLFIVSAKLIWDVV